MILKCGNPVEGKDAFYYSLYNGSNQIYVGATAVRISDEGFVLLIDNLPLLYNSQIFELVLPGDVKIPGHVNTFRLQMRPLSDTMVRVQIGLNLDTKSVQWEFDVNNADLSQTLHKLWRNKPLQKLPFLTVMGGINKVITLTKEVQDV